jgi:hypothetical protein
MSDDVSEESRGNWIVHNALDPRCKPLAIDRSDFECVQSGRIKLDRINDMEFNFWAVVEAHRELVDCSLLVANEWAHHYKLDEVSLVFARSKLGTRLDFFVVAFERYVSSCPGILEKLQVTDARQKFFSPVFDNNFEYRLCCQLRNYAAHKLSAGQGIQVSRSREPKSSSGQISATVKISIEELLRTEKISEKVRRELKALKDRGESYIDLLVLARKVCSLVWDIHLALRDHFANFESEVKVDFDILRVRWNQLQSRIIVSPQLSAKCADRNIFFEVSDDAAVEKIRELTAGLSPIERHTVCSH